MAGWVSKRPDRPKPWLARYRAPDGRERSKSFKRKVDAERWLTAETRKVDTGTWVDPTGGDISFEEWSAKWLAGRVRLTPKTKFGYQGILSSRVNPTFGSTPLARIHRDDVKAWVAEMSDEGLSPSRIRNCFNVLGAALDAAVDEGLIGQNPARGVELPRQTEPERRFLTAEEVDRLAAAMPTRADSSLVVVLAYGGLRFGEAVAVRRGRVDVLRRRIQIAEAATEVGGELVFGPPKTHRRRVVQLPAFVAEALGRHLADRPDDPASLVWVAPKGGPLRYTAFRSRAWDKAAKKAGLPDVTPHDLRHSCASLMRAAGADVKEIQTQLGHRSPVVTLSTYTHLFDDALDPVMDRLDSAHRNLERTYSGPNVTDLETEKSRKASEQGK